MSKKLLSPARRELLAGGALWAASSAGWLRSANAAAAPIFLNDPFQLGVACGDPVPDGFVIWTRLAPDLFDPHALPQENIPVTWEVAADDKFKKIVQSGSVFARPEFAHSVHVDVGGLEPGNTYFYRFHCGAARSRVGRALTLPSARLPLDKFRFAFASCQHYDEGYFTPYRDIIAQDPSLIIHLGDYIYDGSWGTIVRHSPVMDAYSLDEYRLMHAVYKTDPDLQNAHAHCPWMFAWDDHEVANDYSKDQSENTQDPAVFALRKAAAYQAYVEHIPLRAMARKNAEGSYYLFQRVTFGDLMDIHVLDLRQFRDRLACQTPDRHAGIFIDMATCPAVSDPDRTMLGKWQERWFGQNFARQNVRWNVLAQSLMLAGFDQIVGPPYGVFTDNWMGYQGARKKIMDGIKTRKVNNVISIGGDIHSYFANDVKDDPFDPNSATLASEFIGTSITSESFSAQTFAALMPENPHMKFCDDTVRGYVLCDVGRDVWRSTYRIVDNIRIRDPKFSTLKSFAVENGNPGVQIA